MEYASDLNYYYDVGYGSELSANLSCSLMQNMLRYFDDTNENPKTIAYFTHSSSVNLFLRAMGAIHDTDPLRADNFAEMTDRQYKTSQNAPFTANLAAIKYECSDTANSKIRYFLNERPLQLEWCAGGTLCDWTDVQKQYKHFSEADCEKMFCNANADSSKRNYRLSITARMSQYLTERDYDD